MEFLFDSGREPEFIDTYQSNERIKGVFDQSKCGDVLHISPKVTSRQFRKLAPLYAGMGADNVQIHGMVEAVIEDGERKLRLMSPLFILLCDLNNKDRDFVLDEDRTFSMRDVDVVHRDSADKFIEQGTEGKFRVSQLVTFKGVDLDSNVRDIILRVEGYFSGWLQGVIVDNDERLNGFRTARPLVECLPIADDR